VSSTTRRTTVTGIDSPATTFRSSGWMACSPALASLSVVAGCGAAGAEPRHVVTDSFDCRVLSSYPQGCPQLWATRTYVRSPHLGGHDQQLSEVDVTGGRGAAQHEVGPLQVLEALTRALDLRGDGRDHLHRLAGVPNPPPPASRSSPYSAASPPTSASSAPSVAVSRFPSHLLPATPRSVSVRPLSHRRLLVRYSPATRHPRGRFRTPARAGTQVKL
jgi:hypothetical protein